MKKQEIRILIMALVVVSIFQSCTTDDTSLELEDETTGVSNDNTPIVSNRITEIITQWNALWLDIDRYTDGMRPNTTARSLAYIHLAGYETAVADMQGYSSNRNRLQGFNINLNQREDNVDLGLALNTCYAQVIDHFMFSVSSNIKSNIAVLQNEKADELSDGLSQSEIENSIEWGTYVAQRVIAYSQTDNEGEAQQLNPNPDSYVAPVGNGLWVAAPGESAWFPYWNEVRTFVISPAETSSTPPPYAYSENVSSDYYATMDEVNTLTTTARVENNEDLWIAEFWSDDVEGLQLSPPGRQFSIANQLIEEEDLGYEQTLELLLRLGFALNDAAVSAWDDKYTYNTQRPSAYIVKFINPDFVTNLARFISSPNPAFPSYPSGHATFASAAAAVFTQNFGGNSISFTDRTHEGRTQFNGTPRSFSSFSEMAEENAYSRVPLGVHVQADSNEGLRLGNEVGVAVNNFNLNN